MKIKTSHLILETDTPLREGADKLRGFIGRKYPEFLTLHHHIKGTQYLYTYPKVQYMVLEGTPSILGVDEGANILQEISDSLDELQLGKNSYHVEQKVIYKREVDIKPGKTTQYKFITPWLSLNSENYQKFNKMREWRDKKYFLNKILAGNILSMSKGLGIIVNRQLDVHTHLNKDWVKFKGIEVLGFTGEFRVNFKIPDFFGLGKGVSQGFGTVTEVKDVNYGDL